ncbi:hypothetical protein ACFWGI_32330 [Streptomyces niveus]
MSAGIRAGRDPRPGHLDLKPEHVRRRGDGGLVLVDVETLRPDAP